MSSVKIKTEPATTATTAAAAAVVDVKVKLEPSLSIGDIKLEQHASDTETKVESDLEADSDKDNIKYENDDDDDEDDDQASASAKKQRQFICKHPGCGRSFTHVKCLKMHQYEHRLRTELRILGKTYTLMRQSFNDRWPCPIPNCTSTLKTVLTASSHIRKVHASTMKRQQLQPSPAQIIRRKHCFVDVDEFYVNGIGCGYHNAIGVFMCHECRLVSECLLTHLQQKHGYDKKSINNSTLPESAVNVNADPNINQHAGNPHLAAAISQPYQWHHRDIVQGWLCTTDDCGYCGFTIFNKGDHKRTTHQGKQLTTFPALVLRLEYAKTYTSYFLITRIDQASGGVTTSSNGAKQHKFDYSHNGLIAQDENEDDADQSETTEASSQKQQSKCDYPNCGQVFNSYNHFSRHRREHKLEAVTNVGDTTFTLIRRSLNDRWPCPVPHCDKTCKTVEAARYHILTAHSTLVKQKRANSEDGNNTQQPQQEQIIKRRQRSSYYLNVNDFYANGVRCGYHTASGVFICQECRLVPECLLTHLQQKHGFDEKSINSSDLPESVVIANADPNINQHTSNPHLAAAISRPYQQQHQDIIQGWLCTTADCGYCCCSTKYKSDHKKKMHEGEQLSTAPALVLRLFFAKTQTMCFLIIRLDTPSNSVEPSHSTSQHNVECYDVDDGDELVLSDYSD